MNHTLPADGLQDQPSYPPSPDGSIPKEIFADIQFTNYFSKMEPRIREYKIVVWIKGRAKPLIGIRKYLAHQAADVYAQVNQSLLRYYYQDDILKIEITQIDPLQPPQKK